MSVCRPFRLAVPSIVLTMDSDTTQVASGQPGGFTFVNFGTMTVSVGGGPSETFMDARTEVAVQQLGSDGFPPLLTFVIDGASAVGIAEGAFFTYDLKTSIGPISGATLSNRGFPLQTFMGTLVINSTGGDATFTARVGEGAEAVPEPSSWMLLAIGFAGLGLLHRHVAIC
jgi:PEP-CTERM motif